MTRPSPTPSGASATSRRPPLPGTARGRPSLPGWFVLVYSCCLALPGCAFFDWNHVEGVVTVEGTRLGSWTATFPRCKSGSYQMYVGADLFGNGTTVRIAVDATRGPVIQVWKTGANNDGFELTTERCSMFDVKVIPHSDPRSDPLVSGIATFECTVKTGGSVNGSLVFKCE